MAHNVNVKNISVDYSEWSATGGGSGPGGGEGDPNTLVTIAQLEAAYAGSFQLPKGEYGRGNIAVVPGSTSIFFDDWVNGGMPIFEADIPELVNESSDLTQLNTSNIIQSSVNMLPKISQTEWRGHGDPFATNIWGMYHDGNKLFVNGIIVYNASGVGSDTTIRVENPADMENSAVAGCFKLQHALAGSRWFCDVPSHYQADVGADLISGAGLGFPIVGRLSKGASAFGVSKSALLSANDGDTIPQIQLMNYKNKWLHPDYLNYEGACGRVNNSMYVTNSSSAYGVIINGTYAVFGYSEGWDPTPLSFTQQDQPGYPVLEPGQACSNPIVGTLTDSTVRNGALFYKNSDSSWQTKLGQQVDGYGCWDDANRGPYVWLYRMSDILTQPFDEILPYEYGPITTPFAKVTTSASDGHADEIASGSYDPVTKRLYLSLPYANNSAHSELYAGPYVVMVIDLSGIIV